MQCSCQNTANPVSRRIDIVHPVLPEDGEHAERPHDAVEECEHDKEEGEDVADDGKGRREGADPLAPGGLEEEEEHRHQEDVACCAAVGGEAGGEVPKEPVYHRTDDRDGNFRDHHCGAERDPAVDPRREFARLPERHVCVEFGYDGVDDGGWKDEDQKCAEHAVLHVLDRITELPECEADEDSDDDGNEELAIEIRGISPVLDEYAFREKGGLEPHRCRELTIRFSIFGFPNSSTALSLDSIDFSEDGFLLIRVTPFFVPVDTSTVVCSPFGCRLEDELGDVLVRRALPTSICEISNNILSVIANESWTQTRTSAHIRTSSKRNIELCLRHL